MTNPDKTGMIELAGTVWNGRKYVPGYSGMATDLYRYKLEGRRFGRNVAPALSRHPVIEEDRK